jgi:DHA1 family tetracycline resistance protein-like MFS transporter
MGKVGAAHGAGFIIGPAIGGFLSIYGLSTLGFVAAALTGVNLLFAFFFLPESNVNVNSSTQTSVNSDGYWRRLASALTKPLIGAVFIILFVTTFAFSAIPVIVPLLGIAFFGFAELEMSYFFMYIGVVQIVLQGVLIGRLTRRWGEENLMVFWVSTDGVWYVIYAAVSQYCRLFWVHHFDIVRHRHIKHGSAQLHFEENPSG